MSSEDIAALQARLAAIVESSDDAIVSKTLDGVILTWNTGAQRIFGYTADEAIGSSISDLLIPSDRLDEESYILSQIRQGNGVGHYQTVRRTKSGGLIDISVTISPVRDATGRIIAASKIARDISREKEIERELQRAKETAEAGSRAKDYFLSVLSHELRTPLTPALAALSFLEGNHNIPPDARVHLRMIRRNIETQARLVDDLLDVTRIRRGQIRLHFEVVDVHHALRSALSMMQPEIDARSIEIVSRLHATRAHVWADAGRLQQIFLNLLSNAAKFTPKDGSIRLQTSDNDGNLVVQISDTGVGVPPESIPDVFSPFEQTAEGRKHGGLGLGLFITRMLVEKHGGQVCCTSAGKDKGTTFTLDFPTVDKTPAYDEEREKSVSAISSCRILLVEDHDDTRRMMELLLKSFGCAVTAAASVAEALRVADSLQPDLLVSDIGLPDGSGLDVMRWLREHQHSPRGIALSGYGREEDLRRSIDAGFDMHLTKPVTLSMLQEAITKLTSAA